MLIELKPDIEGLNEYNANMRELKQKHPDLLFDELETINNKFIPYQELLNQNGWKGCNNICSDREEDFTGFYICDCNDHYDIEKITTFKEVDSYLNSPIYFNDYGVADNATQVYDYFMKLVKENQEYMSKKDWIIILDPIFREQEPEDYGWRWHKWGEYIGVHDIKCEYIHDEEGIDYVYIFKIVEVEKK